MSAAIFFLIGLLTGVLLTRMRVNISAGLKALLLFLIGCAVIKVRKWLRRQT